MKPAPITHPSSVWLALAGLVVTLAIVGAIAIDQTRVIVDVLQERPRPVGDARHLIEWYPAIVGGTLVDLAGNYTHEIVPGTKPVIL